MDVLTDKLVLELTQQCPNVCLHCSSNSSPTAGTTIPLEKAILLVDQAINVGAKTIVLSGGEPLVYKDLVPLISHINQSNQADVIIYTSGSGLDAARKPIEFSSEDFQRFKDLKIKRFNLSLHSHTPAIHDEFMGVEGSWKRGIAFLENAVAGAFVVHVHSVITHLNYGEIYRLATCLEIKGVQELRLLRLVRQGRADRSEVFNRLEPTEGDWSSVRKQLRSFVKSGGTDWSLSIHLGAHLSIMGKGLPISKEYECSLDQGKLLIEPDGTASLCPALKGLKHLTTGGFTVPPNALAEGESLGNILNTAWRSEVKELKSRFTGDCPAQTIYSSQPVKLTRSQAPAKGSPVELSDSYLIECLDQNLGRLGFPDHCADKIREAVKGIKSLDDFGQSKFSLFYYSSQARNAKNGKSLIGLDELWRVALEGAIHILKQHDLRENPTRLNPSVPDWEITPPPIDDLVRYYKQAAEFERVIYGFDPWYRDHFAHVIKVWLIGLAVIVNLGEGQLTSPDFTRNPELDSKLFENEELYAAFTIAALTHDLGYPLQKIAKLNEVLAKTLESIGGVDWQPLQFSLSLPRHQSAQHLLSLLSSRTKFRWFSGQDMTDQQVVTEVPKEFESYKTATSRTSLVRPYSEGGWGVFLRTQWKYHEKYHDSLERNHHGLLSALVLLRKLLFFKEGEFALEEDYSFSLEEARQFMIRREIMRALATHTCPEVYILNLLSVESLLFFCDEIQEWGRPQFSDLYEGKRDAGATRVTLYEYDAKKVHWEVNIGESQQSSAAYWLLSSGRKLSDRLRSAPDSPERDFDVLWSLCWKADGREFLGTFHFEGKKGTQDRSRLLFNVKNLGNGKEENIRSHIERLGSGSTFDKVQAELVQILNNL